MVYDTKKAREARAKQERGGRSPAMKHGVYSRVLQGGKVDGRTSLGQAMAALRRQLTQDIGGDPSTQERVLIDRITQKVFQAQALEAAILAGERGPEGFYLSLTNSLRRDLVALGLKRVARDVKDLDTYLKERANEYRRSDK